MDLLSSNVFLLSRRLVVGVVLSMSAFGAWAQDAPIDIGIDTALVETLPMEQMRHTGTQYIPVPHVEKNYSQIVIYRPSGSETFNAGASDIYVNGELQSILKPGEFSTFCLSPGRHVLESYLNDEPLYAGKTTSQSRVQLMGGKTYFIEASREQGRGIPTPVKRIEAESKLFGYTHSTIVNRASSVKPCVFSGNRISLGNVLFQFAGSGAANMETGGQEVVSKMAGYLKNQPQQTRVSIVGYADPVGNPASNRRLSLQRAETIKQLLISEGVPADALLSSGQGSSDPVIECKGKMSVTARNACNRVNRRVDVLIQAKSPTD